jgi:hypothetical protein
MHIAPFPPSWFRHACLATLLAAGPSAAGVGDPTEAGATPTPVRCVDARPDPPAARRPAVPGGRSGRPERAARRPDATEPQAAAPSLHKLPLDCPPSTSRNQRAAVRGSAPEASRA